MILLGFKTELHTNNKQRTLLSKHAGAARFTYNWGLHQKKIAHENKQKTPKSMDLHKKLAILKQTDFPWMYEVSKCAPQEALRNLDKAYDNFFRRVKNKSKNKGFPKFKSKRNGMGSFRLYGIIKVQEKYIQLPRLGKLKLK